MPSEKSARRGRGGRRQAHYLITRSSSTIQNLTPEAKHYLLCLAQRIVELASEEDPMVIRIGLGLIGQAPVVVARLAGGRE